MHVVTMVSLLPLDLYEQDESSLVVEGDVLNVDSESPDVVNMRHVGGPLRLYQEHQAECEESLRAEAAWVFLAAREEVE